MKPTLNLSVVLTFFAAWTSPVTSRIAAPKEETTDRALEEDKYLELGPKLACPSRSKDGLMFKNTETKSVEECFDRCYGVQSCNFFSYKASKNTCLGCVLEDATKMVGDGNNGAGYQMLSTKTKEEFGYELWNGVEGIGKKCPHQHDDRIDRITDTTKDECRQKCEDHEECHWFSWGEDEVEKLEWRGVCILCREDDELQAHNGFNFWVLPTEDASEDSSEDCPDAVKIVRFEGETVLPTDGAVQIISQDVTSVTVRLSQIFTDSEAMIDHAFWQYRPDMFDEKCFESDTVYGGKLTKVTIECNDYNKEAYLNVWIADDASKGLLSVGDNAAIPDCCHPELPEGIPVVEYVFAIQCEASC